MDAVLDRRGEIYDYFNASQSCQDYFFDDAHEAKHVAYYNSMSVANYYSCRHGCLIQASAM